ncbi:creatininase family protein [Haloprofundus salilacus]|uniref:creatininase family protein n=1 Tax=Haloprofundus salilacus TaxID=2876190 RepID=UPI003CCD51AF
MVPLRSSTLVHFSHRLTSGHTKTGTVRYVDLHSTEFEERLESAPIAYLPLGTLEWHGNHLPYGTDGLISGGFFDRLAGV